MHVLFVTSEVAGLYKLGGLGDVSFSLPIALSRLNVKVDIALPYYKDIDLKTSRCIGTIAVDFDHRRHTIFIFATHLPDSDVQVLLFRHPFLEEYLGPDIVERFVFFSLAVAEFAKISQYTLEYTYDVIHCQDWHTAMVPIFLGERNKTKKHAETLASRSMHSIITIHNLMYQGIANENIIEKLSLPKSVYHIFDRAKGSVVSTLRDGLEHADKITTVSPTYAKEIMTSEFGEHMNSILKQRSEDVIGILNGIDDEGWNPAVDDTVFARYYEHTVIEAKRLNKASLQSRVKLPVSDVPLIGFIGRLDAKQKGLDILLSAMRQILKEPQLQLVILGTGQAETEEAIQKFTESHESVRFLNMYDEAMAHMLYGGLDMLLVPSRYEPCGLIQMIAMRYGTVPIVRRTGGLADTVRHKQTGFVFVEYSDEALEKAVRLALQVYKKQPTVWQKMVKAGMKKDFSWKQSGRTYKRLYEKMIRSSKTSKTKQAKRPF